MIKINKTAYKAKDGFYHNVSHNKTKIVIGDTCRSKFIEGLNCLTYPTLDRYPTFTIMKDGTIYQHFNPEFFNNLTPNKDVNKQSISIYLDNLNSVTFDDEFGEYYDAFNIASDVDVKMLKWKKIDYWETYTKNQYISLANLINYLCDKFKINKEIFGDNLFDKKSIDFEGILSLSNLDIDSNSVNPSFSFENLMHYL